MQRCLVGVALIAAAACGSSVPQTQTDAAAKNLQQGAKTVEQGARQMAAGVERSAEQMAQGSAKAVDYEQLKALLPDVDGWTRSDTKGEQLTMPMVYSRAETRYRKGDSRIELEITDTALSQLLLAPMSMFLASGYSERSDDGFKRATRIGGQPGLEEWRAEPKRGEVTAVVSGRFIVKAAGYDVESLDPVRKVVESVNVSRLASIK